MSDEPDLHELAARALVAREYATKLAEAMRLKGVIHPRSDEDWQAVCMALIDALAVAWEFINAASDIEKNLDDESEQP